MNLAGKTILNCRPDEDSSGLNSLIAAHHGHVVHCPALRRVPLLSGDHGDQFIMLLERVGPGAIAAFTSPHGVRLAVAFLQDCGEIDLLSELEIAVVGDGTRAEARELGLSVSLRAEEVHGEGLARSIIEAYGTASGRPAATLPPVVLIRNEAADKAPNQLLHSGGFTVYDFAAYRSDGIESSRFFESVIRFVDHGGRFDYAVLSSAEGVRQYSKLLGRFEDESGKAVAHLRHVPVVAFAPKTALAVREFGFTLAGTAEKPSDEEVIRAIELAVLAGRIP